MNLTLEVFFMLLDNKPLTNNFISDVIETDVRNVQRAIKRIKKAFDESELLRQHFELKESKIKRTFYHTINQKNLLRTDQILLLIKILVASRSLNPTEMKQITDQMLKMVNLEDKNVVEFGLDSDRNPQSYLGDLSDRESKLWSLDQYIIHQDMIKFDYTDHEAKENTQTVTLERIPVHTFFDNYYFFMVGWDKYTNEYQIYHLDWMNNITVSSNVNTHIDHKKRLNHGEEALHRAYGYMGRKIRIRFEYYGYLGYVKDRFPSCRIIKKLDKKNKFPFSVNLVEIEVYYSYGVKLWLLGQTTILKVVEPDNIAQDIKKTLYQSYQMYNE